MQRAGVMVMLVALTVIAAVALLSPVITSDSGEQMAGQTTTTTIAVSGEEIMLAAINLTNPANDVINTMTASTTATSGQDDQFAPSTNADLMAWTTTGKEADGADKTVIATVDFIQVTTSPTTARTATVDILRQHAHDIGRGADRTVMMTSANVRAKMATTDSGTTTGAQLIEYTAGSAAG